MSCVAAWHVKKPQVVVMHGAATDNNATLFAQGYDAVLNPFFKSGKYATSANTAGTWDPPTAETEFQAGLHGAPEHQRGADPQRRERRADHHVPAGASTSSPRPSRPPGRTPR